MEKGDSLEKWRKRLVQGILILAVLVVVIMNFQRTYRPILASDSPPANDWLLVAEYLVANDYEIAYATFDHAGPIEVLAGSEVIVAAVADMSKLNISKWLNNKEWFPPVRPFEERIAIITSAFSNGDFLEFIDLNGYHDIITEECRLGMFFVYSSPYNFANLAD
jgi:hypothetical protein